ncbi:MAG: DUF1311 domain-containing protein [Lachnospiraceae bacterium]|nr:DUF1311 domain-containing protein [Lachnospiraceae bacterium]
MKTSKIIVILMTVCMTLALVLTGCAGLGHGTGNAAGDPSTWPDGWEPIGEEAAPQAQAGNEDAGSPAGNPAGEAQVEASDGAQAETAGGLTFADLQDIDFNFSSGAGGWGTELHIGADGSFSGSYHDSEMGEVTEETPHGAYYCCDFKGQFTELKKVNEYTYSTSIAQMTYEKEAGTEEVKDQMMYKYTDPYGLDSAETLYIYLPEAKVVDLPEAFVDWVRMAMNYEDRQELGFYGLYNEAGEAGFSGFPKDALSGGADGAAAAAGETVSDGAAGIKSALQKTEEAAAALQAELDSDIPQTQMNLTSGELYQVWDDQLNLIWAYLKDTLDAGAMKTLTAEQVKWIDNKESEVAKAAAEYEGGSIAPLVANTKAAELTRDRVYELMEYVK